MSNSTRLIRRGGFHGFTPDDSPWRLFGEDPVESRVMEGREEQGKPPRARASLGPPTSRVHVTGVPKLPALAAATLGNHSCIATVTLLGSKETKNMKQRTVDFQTASLDIANNAIIINSSTAWALQLPRINRYISISRCQDPHSNNVVEPVVLSAARLKQQAQVYTSILLRGPAGADEDVGAIVCLELVARVGREGATPVDKTPVCAEVEDLAC